MRYERFVLDLYDTARSTGNPSFVCVRSAFCVRAAARRAPATGGTLSVTWGLRVRRAPAGVCVWSLVVTLPLFAVVSLCCSADASVPLDCGLARPVLQGASAGD
jgi:hypothetical protein